MTVKYPANAVTKDDKVTNTATITAAVQNDPTTVMTKSADFTHGFAERRVLGYIYKSGSGTNFLTRNRPGTWTFSVSDSGNTSLHARWEDTVPARGPRRMPRPRAMLVMSRHLLDLLFQHSRKVRLRGQWWLDA